MLLGGCAGASHHVRTMGFRRTPRADACDVASLPMHDDRGPDRPREAFAVVTAECRESKEEECRQHLRLGGCEARADALIEVTNRVVNGRRRMVATAVEYTAEGASAGGETPAP
jgi:hypothetical protein